MGRSEEQWECHFSHVSRQGSEVRDVVMVRGMHATHRLRGTWGLETTYTGLVFGIMVPQGSQEDH